MWFILCFSIDEIGLEIYEKEKVAFANFSFRTCLDFVMEYYIIISMRRMSFLYRIIKFNFN